MTEIKRDEHVVKHAQLCKLQPLTGTIRDHNHYVNQRYEWCSGADCRTCWIRKQEAKKHE